MEPSTDSGKSCTRVLTDDRRSLWFPGWKEALAAAPLPAETKQTFRQEILSFLHHCKARRAPATVMLVKQYLPDRERQGANEARSALRWFFRQGRLAGVAVPPAPTGVPATRAAMPPPAALDQGGADWERDLIKTSRTKGFLWRTEETYRGWAARFVGFIAPGSPYAAGGEEVAAFLTSLAVNLRASPSTQKQALNALVFFMQEALHRDLGKMDFRRAYPQQRMPTVLTRGECKRLFDELEGTPRLMAEL
jgi:hypothetical protein